MSRPQFIRFGREICSEPRRFNPIIALEVPDGQIVRNPLNSGSHPHWLRFRMRWRSISPDHTWYEDFDLSVEAEIGLPCRDHHLCIGECLLSLINGEWSGLTASLEEKASPYIEEAMRRFFDHDDSLRPNQIHAVSLPFSPLSDEAQRHVVNVCGRAV